MRWPICIVTLILSLGGARLHAADPAGPLERIAFGSCAEQDRALPIWDAIVASKPNVFLFLGDNIYGDTEDMEILRAKYAKLGAMPGYQKLTQTCPILATWDDHDYGVNDGGNLYPKRVESQEIFLDFFGVPKDSPRRKQEGVYNAQIFGPEGKRVQVIMLDTRYFRSPLKKKAKFERNIGPYLPTDDPTATMLGDKQWKWFEEQLRMPAEVRIIGSSIQVVPEDHGWEKWMNIPHERARLFDLLRDTKAAGVIFLSGDRHLAELSVMDAGIGYPLYDLTSSGLNQAFKKWRPQEANRHRVGTMNFGDNSGLILIDWEKEDPIISLQIRDVAGEIFVNQKIPLSLLQPGSLVARSGKQVARLPNGKSLTKAAIKDLVDKKCTLELEVRATGMSTALVFLNSAENRLDDDNFTVVLDKAAQEKLKAGGISDVRKHYLNKVISVTGTLTLFRDKPQIMVSDPAAQIEILED